MPFNRDAWEDSTAKARWLEKRCGVLTSSVMCDAMAYTKKGESTAARRQLLMDLCAERVTQQSVRHYVTAAMQWGLDKQPDAVMAYEIETGLVVHCDPYRFTLHPDEQRFSGMLGASDDGFIGHDGQIEIKCPSTSTFISWWRAGVVPEEHKPQMIVELECSRRQWIDFVAFDPRIMRPDRRLFIRRYIPDEEERANVLAAADQFLRELDEMFYQFTHG